MCGCMTRRMDDVARVNEASQNLKVTREKINGKDVIFVDPGDVSPEEAQLILQKVMDSFKNQSN